MNVNEWNDGITKDFACKGIQCSQSFSYHIGHATANKEPTLYKNNFFAFDLASAYHVQMGTNAQSWKYITIVTTFYALRILYETRYDTLKNSTSFISRYLSKNIFQNLNFFTIQSYLFSNFARLWKNSTVFKL